MRGLTYRFDNKEILSRRLLSHEDDRDIDLPCCTGLREGEWVLATFQVGDESTAVAGCVVDRGDQLRLLLESRDWERLAGFACGDGPPSARIAVDAEPLAAVEPPPNCNVLLVEENPDVQAMVATALRASGYHVCGATSAEEALDRLRDSSYNLVIAEQRLPGMSGKDFCSRVRRDASLRELPILLLTSHASTEAMSEALSFGASDVMCKPFRVRELTARSLSLLRCAATAHAS